MYITQNPVLQYELLSNLRLPRAFVLLFAYIALLGGVVFLAWPQEQKLDFAQPEAAKRLVQLFFFGQYMLASLDGAQLRGGGDHGREGTRQLRDAARQPHQAGRGLCWASCSRRSRTWAS